MTTVDYGDELTATATFVNGADANADPDVVRAITRSPDGSETTYTYGVDVEMTQTDTGVYVLTWTPGAPGDWVVRFEGVGTVTQATEQLVAVTRSRVASASHEV